MSEHNQENQSSVRHESDSDLVMLIQKMHQQLVYLEKKVDILISQSQSQPQSYQEKRFTKPFQNYGRPRPSFDRDNRGQGRDSRDSRSGGFRSGQKFEKSYGEDNRGYDGPKKSFGQNREGRTEDRGHFKKKFDGNKGGFDPRKKPFYENRKRR